jgi:hypothetical protein
MTGGYHQFVVIKEDSLFFPLENRDGIKQHKEERNVGVNEEYINNSEICHGGLCYINSPSQKTPVNFERGGRTFTCSKND